MYCRNSSLNLTGIPSASAKRLDTSLLMELQYGYNVSCVSWLTNYLKIAISLDSLHDQSHKVFRLYHGSTYNAYEIETLVIVRC